MTIRDGLINAGPRTLEESQAVMAVNRGKPYRFSFGYSRTGPNGAILDFRPVVDNLQENYGTASVAAHILNVDALESGAYKLTRKDVVAIRNYLTPFEKKPGAHINIHGLDELVLIMSQFSTDRYESLLPSGYEDIPVMVVQMKPDDVKVATFGEAFLRLTLISQRKIKPRESSMEDIFGVLLNLVRTNYGPIQLEDIEQARRELPGLVVFGIDRFPRMVDYVIPSGVRIADADRVRLGAYLSEGTTVMHEGFVNFNAGTLGVSMVEGRISAGVTVGNGSDIGGGASIMGTLSGGGKEVITIGERTLLGANSGLGIPIGDDCIVEAGLYLTAGMPVFDTINNRWAKARDFAGASGVLFRRNSGARSGVVEVVAREGKGVILNSVLHAN
jgi:2,3,4,5-tetrahydropyridine-2-carboxylate N-succinyltransferase